MPETNLTGAADPDDNWRPIDTNLIADPGRYTSAMKRAVKRTTDGATPTDTQTVAVESGRAAVIAVRADPRFRAVDPDLVPYLVATVLRAAIPVVSDAWLRESKLAVDEGVEAAFEGVEPMIVEGMQEAATAAVAAEREAARPVFDRLTADSTTLNTIAYAIARALGKVEKIPGLGTVLRRLSEASSPTARQPQDSDGDETR